MRLACFLPSRPAVNNLIGRSAAMEALKARLDAFQRSGVGRFLRKVRDDQATNLAALLAWRILNALLPLLLGILALAGLVLRDPERLDQVYSTLLALVPSN